MDTPLQPLRITSGWTVSFNDGLYAIDPESAPLNDFICYFKADMLQLEHKRYNRLLDLGWHTSDYGTRKGSYVVQLLEGDFRGALLHKFTTRNRIKLVAEIERILYAVTEGKL